jgi:hypothetical protein
VLGRGNARRLDFMGAAAHGSLSSCWPAIVLYCGGAAGSIIRRYGPADGHSPRILARNHSAHPLLLMQHAECAPLGG